VNKPIGLRQRIARWIVGTSQSAGATTRRNYANARPSRFNVGLGASGNSSADAELSLSLPRLRASSRQMIRDASYAKRAKVLVVNNVIGPGIGMQAQVMTTRGELNPRVNDDIERAWADWCCAEECHTGGKLHFSDFERAAMGQVFEAGECFIRLHFQKFGDSEVPLALELIEPERLASDRTQPAALTPDAQIRMGVEVDNFGRPLAYWVSQQHPGDLSQHGWLSNNKWERVPAANMLHLYRIDRWPQSRGEPWMHTVLRKLDSIDQYSSAELQAAQADAYNFGVIHTSNPEGMGALANNQAEQGTGAVKPEMQIESGVVLELEPGEEMSYHQPSRPNTALDPFLRYMLREVAAGVGVSYESISRDYSQSNYSSSRLALLDDRDLWRVTQQWWLRNFRCPLHEIWLQQAVLAGAVPTIPLDQYGAEPDKFEAVKFKPRGWSWIDPTKEVAAFKEAEKAGYISAEDIIAQTANGLDIEDVVKSIARSNELYEEAGIERDTDVAATNAAAAAKSAPVAPMAAPPPDPEEAGDGATNKPNDPPARVVSIAR
jgi:lambda family phage portal protein